jgi:arsenite-transporting ATPase
VPVLTARYFDEEVIGGPMLDRLGAELFDAGGDGGAAVAPQEIMYSDLAHKLSAENGTTTLRLRVPFSERGDLALKKVGAELVVTVGHQKRTIILPSALARQRPTGARLEDGSLEVSFSDGRGEPR